MELQVQKFEARHQKITQENKFNMVSSFANRVAPYSYSQSRTFLRRVAAFDRTGFRVIVTQGCLKW